VLDLCCGTGDLALSARDAGGDVTAVDFSAPMLERARPKSSEIVWLEADALHLPLADASFDAVTIGFGLRNVASAEQGLAEMRRVLRPGGRAAVLDVTRPQGLLTPFYKVWFDALIPAVGKLVPGGAAFTYLPASVRRFPGPRDLARLMEEAGFEQIRWRLFAGGIVALHTGVAR
jgi:demethylmenaquinone methyltransferase/2-methoxy-6-polyprenyl-1,4-benzoquinol methylase